VWPKLLYAPAAGISLVTRAVHLVSILLPYVTKYLARSSNPAESSTGAFSDWSQNDKIHLKGGFVSLAPATRRTYIHTIRQRIYAKYMEKPMLFKGAYQSM
jgi:hypothetical protein